MPADRPKKKRSKLAETGKFRTAGILLERWAIGSFGSTASFAKQAGVSYKAARLWVLGTSWPRSADLRNKLRGLRLPLAVENEWWKVMRVGLDLTEREVAVVEAMRAGNERQRQAVYAAVEAVLADIQKEGT